MPIWSWWRESNPRPSAYEALALPAELHQHRTLRFFYIVYHNDRYIKPRNNSSIKKTPNKKGLFLQNRSFSSSRYAIIYELKILSSRLSPSCLYIVKHTLQYSEIQIIFRKKWCRGSESNRPRRPFQGRALPLSYLGTATSVLC